MVIAFSELPFRPFVLRYPLDRLTVLSNVEGLTAPSRSKGNRTTRHGDRMIKTIKI